VERGESTGDREESAALERLASLVGSARSGRLARLSAQELRQLPRLYRHASSELARLETHGAAPARTAELRRLLARAHGVLFRDLRPARGGPLARAASFLLSESPRAIRAEWRLIAGLFALFYILAAVAFAAVRADLELAFSLTSAEMVTQEIAQLRATEAGQPFAGNFTFGLGESPAAAGMIFAHNIFVSLLFFGSGLLPPLYLLVLASNALMVGTYTGVAAHWGQAGSISSILWCHGVIELQMIVLAGAAGLVLVRAWVAPGPWTRRHAMVLESRRAWALFAPVLPFLVLAGLIEGYVSPHAPPAARAATAVTSALVLVAWATLGGRAQRPRLAPENT